MRTEQTQIELVVTQSRLAQVVDHISRAPRVAFDIESNGFFRYHERICLVQLATAETAFLLDPLAIEDFQPLGDLMSDGSVEKVFHAADYDLRSLDRDWGFHVSTLFDTSIAAALTGSTQLGLQAVLQAHLGVELNKHRKLQRSDWTKRPLSAEGLSYAANDVLYLGRVRDVLVGRLKSLSRLEWAKEEFERLETVRHLPRDRDSAFLSIKGSRTLDGRGLALLRSLFQFPGTRGPTFRPAALQGDTGFRVGPVGFRSKRGPFQRQRPGAIRPSACRQSSQSRHQRGAQVSACNSPKEDAGWRAVGPSGAKES